MARLIKETSSALRIVIIGAFFLTFLFCVAGIWLVYLGASGSTEFTFFGQAFKSTNVGVAALFLGAASVVLLLRRTLKTLDIAVNAESPAQSSRVPSGYWPRSQTRKSLEARINALSDNQWSVVLAIAQQEGISSHRLCELFGGYSIFYDRLERLENEQLITIHKDNVYLASRVKQLLRGQDIRQIRGPVRKKSTITDPQ